MEAQQRNSQCKKGLKQGDVLAPFLYLVVAEGLNGLMKNAVSKGMFKGCKIGIERLEMSNLQYADDTLLVGEVSWENLWVMKVVLRFFEVVSGLKVNYKKTRLTGINVEEDFINLAAEYQWELIQGTSQLWEPIIASLERKLALWKGRYLSFGGRVSLISSVLHNIPIIFLSILRIPKKVLKILIRIQREFLWGSVRIGKLPR